MSEVTLRMVLLCHGSIERDTVPIEKPDRVEKLKVITTNTSNWLLVQNCEVLKHILSIVDATDDISVLDLLNTGLLKNKTDKKKSAVKLSGLTVPGTAVDEMVRTGTVMPDTDLTTDIFGIYSIPSPGYTPPVKVFRGFSAQEITDHYCLLSNSLMPDVVTVIVAINDISRTYVIHMPPGDPRTYDVINYVIDKLIYDKRINAEDSINVIFVDGSCSPMYSGGNKKRIKCKGKSKSKSKSKRRYKSKSKRMYKYKNKTRRN
jgi:hypothetical protein